MNISDDKAIELLENVATIMEHVEGQNGRLDRIEKSIETAREVVSKLRAGVSFYDGIRWGVSLLMGLIGALILLMLTGK